MKGVDKAIWWVEYVIRNKDIRHLRSPAADMSFHEYYMLDIIFVLVLSAFVIWYVTINIIKFILVVLSGGIQKKLKRN